MLWLRARIAITTRFDVLRRMENNLGRVRPGGSVSELRDDGEWKIPYREKAANYSEKVSCATRHCILP